MRAHGSFRGVWAAAQALEGRRDEPHEALKHWLLLGLRLGHTLPAHGVA